MSWECRFGFRPRDLRLRPDMLRTRQSISSQPLGWAGAGCLAFSSRPGMLRAAFAQSRRLATSFSFRAPPWRGRGVRPGGRAITASWIAASIIGMLSTGLSAHSHQRSKERRANFKRVLFQRSLLTNSTMRFLTTLGSNADPQYLRIQANALMAWLRVGSLSLFLFVARTRG